MRKAIFVTLLSTLILASALPSNANPTLESIRGMKIVDGQLGGTLTTYLAGVSKDWTEYSLCSGPSDPKCSNLVLNPSAYLVPCNGLNTLGCISEVYAVDRDGKKLQAKFLKSIGRGDNNFSSEDSKIGLVAGEGSGGLWEFSGLTSSNNKSLFVVQVNLAGGNAGFSKVTYDRTALAISPVNEVAGNFSAKSVHLTEGRRGLGFHGANTDETGRLDCVTADSGICYARSKFPAGYRFGMRVILPNALSGWFHGRMELPSLSITENTSGAYEYQVEALPVLIPNIEFQIPQSSWNSDFRKYVQKHWPMSNGGAYLLPGNFGVLAQEMAKLSLPMVKDKASSSSQIWLLKTLDSFGNGGVFEIVDRKVMECSADTRKVSGLVMSNATVYTQGPPRFNSATATLDYSVLSPHYDETGAENLGSYDLVLDSKVARCIYGFSNAPIKAEIEVLGDDGKEKIVTKVLGEKDGRMYLSAKGFTFSEPVIKVKFSQEPVANVEEVKSESIKTETKAEVLNAETTAVAIAKPVVVAKKKLLSITCVKNRITRKVIGVNPKCPTGFKRK